MNDIRKRKTNKVIAMDIKAHVEDVLIKMRENDAEIVEIYKTGSQLTRRDPHDYDYEIICRNFKQRFKIIQHKENDYTYDMFIIDEKALEYQLDFNDEYYTQYRLKLFNYLFAIRESIYGHYNNGWNMLDHREEYEQYVIKIYDINNSKVNPNTVKNGKFYIHYYMILKLFENNSLELTDEIIENANALYSNENCQHLID